MIGHNLIELDAVMAVARRKSFRAAAVELQISTTALSNLIAKFEKQLGVRLFNRTTRSVSLTDAGRNFVEQIGPALVEIHSAMDSAMSQQEVPSGTISGSTRSRLQPARSWSHWSWSICADIRRCTSTS